jgi:hypothetical protein
MTCDDSIPNCTQQKLNATYATVSNAVTKQNKESVGPLVRLGEAQRLTGLTRYTLLGLARRRVIRLKSLPCVSNPRSGKHSYYLYREDLDRILEGSAQTLQSEDVIERAAIARKRRLRRFADIASDLDGVVPEGRGAEPANDPTKQTPR